MPTRKCPVCKVMPVLRKDIKTCSVNCAREWNSWSYEQKVRALSGNDDLTEQEVESDQAELDKWIRSSRESS